MLSALMVGVITTSPHMFHYDMLLVVLPAILWLRAARDPAIAATTAAVKPILALGFIWLAVAGPVAAVTHVQLSPILMLVWLIVLHRAVR